MSAVVTQDRFKRRDPCPVCEGGQDDKPHKGIRCTGFRCTDPRYVYCSRVTSDKPTMTPAGQCWLHWQGEGACRHFGQTHVLVPVSGQAQLQLLHKPALAVKTPPKPINRPAQMPKHWELGLPVRAFESRRRGDKALMAISYRFEWPVEGKAKPEKTYRFWRTGWSLDDLPLEDVPLFNMQALDDAPADCPVWLCEGQPAAVALQEALRAAGLSAVVLATYGATAIPSDAQLGELCGHGVTLWSDRDEAGDGWRDTHTALLQALGISVRVCVWPDAPPKGDAVEYFASGSTVAGLAALTTPANNAACQPQSLNSTPSRHLDFSPDEVTLLRKRIAHLEAREVWLRELLANQDLTAQHKVAAIVARVRLLDQTWHAEAQPVPVYLPALAEACGVKSPQTMSDALRTLADCGAISYHTERGSDPNGQPVTRSYIARQPALATPAMLKPETARKQWGGKRAGAGRRCKGCGGARLVLRQQMVCEDCGTVEALPDVAVNPPDDEAPEARLPTLYSVKDVQGEQEQEDTCTVCGGKLECYDAAGVAFCLKHAPQQEAG